MTDFSQKILTWYSLNKRDLPWRNISDPYKIWVSEIILQQTQIVQGHDYYLRFLNTFPTIESLANASEDEVAHLLDNMFGFCGDERFQMLFKQICRKYYKKYPEQIAFQIKEYREYYDTDKEVTE